MTMSRNQHGHASIDNRGAPVAFTVTCPHPNVVLEPMGPYMDLTLRRHQAPAADTFKEACKRAPG